MVSQSGLARLARPDLRLSLSIVRPSSLLLSLPSTVHRAFIQFVLSLISTTFFRLFLLRLPFARPPGPKPLSNRLFSAPLIAANLDATTHVKSIKLLSSTNSVTMSANLDKSLDDIVVGRRQDARRRGSRRNKASAAPGGVKKNKATKASAKGAKSAPAAAPPKDSKIMVSGMVSSMFFSL